MILVRHSLPEFDPAVASMNWRLSAEGRTRSRVLADQLGRLTPDAVYSSPEPKALETAEIVGAVLDLGVTVIADLREHDRTGVPFLTAPGAFEEKVLRLFADPDACVFGTESATTALARFSHGIRQLLARRDRQPLVVTHGTVMSLYLAAMSGLAAADVWRKLGMPCYRVAGALEPGSVGIGIEHPGQ